MKVLMRAVTALTVLVTIAAVASLFLAIWSTGGFWPVRFGGSFVALLVMACPLWLVTLFLWDD